MGQRSKLPIITKLPSGSWRAQVQINGHRHSVTGPDKQSVQEQIMRLKLDGADIAKGTVAEAVEQYISDRESVLSVSTIRRYRQFQKNDFKDIQRMKLSAITDSICQKSVSRMAKEYSAKTVTNSWRFFQSAMSAAGKKVTVRLPTVVRNEHPFLEPDQIKVFLKAIEGHRLEIPMLLGLHGLRKSEIFGLKWTDIDFDKKTIHVAGSAVIDSDNMLIYKPETKNTSSNRYVPILIPRLLTLLEDADKTNPHIVDCGRNAIYEAVNRICEREGLPLIGVHGLRHTFCSLCYGRVSEMVCMKLGGWSDYGTMRSIYTHLAEKELANSASKLASFFSEF